MTNLMVKVLLCPISVIELVFHLILLPFRGCYWLAGSICEALVSTIDYIVFAKWKLENVVSSLIQEYQTEVCDEELMEKALLGKTKEYPVGKFAMYIGKRAYLQFGARSNSTANKMVTRKWVRNLLQEEYKTLRITDMVNIMDQAVFYSFIPTSVHAKCEEMASTSAYMEMLPKGNTSS